MSSITRVVMALLSLTLVAGAADGQSVAPMSEILGSWRSEADPRSVFMISRAAGERSLRIVTAGAFEALGFADGAHGVALVRSTPANGSSWAQHGGVLRLQQTSEDTLSIAFARELRGEPTKQDRWVRQGAKPSEAQPPASAGSRQADHVQYGDVQELPMALERVPPVYSAEMREKRLEGTVMIQALVGTHGEVLEVKVTKSIPGLDDAAVAAVKRWKFKPALTDGRPVVVWVGVPVKFSYH